MTNPAQNPSIRDLFDSDLLDYQFNSLCSPHPFKQQHQAESGQASISFSGQQVQHGGGV